MNFSSETITSNINICNHTSKSKREYAYFKVSEPKTYLPLLHSCS